jgi:hypothetical protein
VDGWMKPTWLDFWEIRIVVSSGGGGADKKIISTRTKRFTVICAMAQRPSSNLILIDVDSLCHGTVKSCAMARRPSSNLILIDVDSLCHGTKC